MLDLQGEQKANGLNTLPPSINIVPKEEIAWLGRKSSILEEAQHVIVLAMDISTDFEWGGNFEEHWLFHEDVLDYPDESKYLVFFESD